MHGEDEALQSAASPAFLINLIMYQRMGRPGSWNFCVCVSSVCVTQGNVRELLTTNCWHRVSGGLTGRGSDLGLLGRAD